MKKILITMVLIGMAFELFAGKADLKIFDKLIDTCNKGEDARVCYILGSVYRKGEGSIKKDIQKANDFFKKACDGGNMAGCYEEANSYDLYSEKLKKKDIVYILKRFVHACSGDVIRGCSTLGYIFENGDVVKQNYKDAASYYAYACKKGDMESCHSLGELYEKGEGVAKNISKALDLYAKACDNGSANACKAYWILKIGTKK